MKHQLPELPYSYDALEPWIDARTMEIHHSKHHATYVAKLNETVEHYPEWREKPVEELLQKLDKLPDAIRAAVKNHAGGHYNHSLFWTVMRKGGADVLEPSGDIGNAISAHYGTFDAFRAEFTRAATSVFGSGWAWMVIKTNNGQQTTNNKLEIITTPNQDCPLSKGLTPILCLDVWEHAYYLKYQNRRPEYIENWWHVVNWDAIGEHFKATKK